MKLRQNAKELVLIEVDGLGLILGHIRYNRQTETVLFALEKAAFFDLYFPCTVVYDQQKGPVVHPHILSTMTTSSIRIQRSRVSCFILETDLNPELVRQYQQILEAIIPKPQHPEPPEPHDPGPGGGKPKPPGGSRVISIRDLKDKP